MRGETVCDEQRVQVARGRCPVPISTVTVQDCTVTVQFTNRSRGRARAAPASLLGYISREREKSFYYFFAGAVRCQ